MARYNFTFALPARTVAQTFLDPITFPASKSLSQARRVIECLTVMMTFQRRTVTHAILRTLPIAARLCDNGLEEKAGLIKRKTWDRVIRSTLLPSDTIFQMRFHSKIKRNDGKFEKCKVRLVVRGDRMTKKDESGIGDFEDAFRSIPHASGLRLLLAIVAQRNTHTDHVDISQAFTQGEILDGDGQNGKVYISAPPGFPEDTFYCYILKRPLYGMPSASRSKVTTISEILTETEGCSKVAYEESMWQGTQNGLHSGLIAWSHPSARYLSCY